MKPIYSFLSLFIFLSSTLTACTALLPQSPAPEEADKPANAPASGVVVEEVVEQVVIGQNGEPGPVTVEIIGGDEAALREFISRQVTYPGAEADHITVYLGTLPPELPYELPLPDAVRVIGSVQQTNDEVLQVIEETSLTPDEVQTFYAEALPAAGWQLADGPNYGGGFVSDDFSAMYCQGEEVFLSFSTGELPDGKTDVRIYIQSSQEYSPCAPGQEQYGDPIADLIPALKNPPGTRMSSSGGGGGSSGSDSYNETHLEGDISAPDAAAYYNDQLTAAGWTLVESGSADGLGWSTWTFTDADGDAWMGTLLVSDIPPGSGKLFAYVRVERVP
jgi:hypothetical protein